MATPVHQLLYASAATSPMLPADLSALLAKARSNNQRLGLTGILVHHSGSFFQVLEGEHAVVERLFERIRADARHDRVIILSSEQVPTRSFGEWTMGFVEMANERLARTPGYNDLFRRGLEPAQVKPGRVRDMVLAFRDGRFRQYVDA